MEVFLFSSLSFTIANLIFIIFAPNIHKENKDYGEFKSSGRNEIHLERYFKEDRKDAPHTLNSHKQEDNKTWFWSMYKRQDEIKVQARYVSVIFYIIGFILLFYVFMMNLLWVIRESFF